MGPSPKQKTETKDTKPSPMETDTIEPEVKTGTEEKEATEEADERTPEPETEKKPEVQKETEEKKEPEVQKENGETPGTPKPKGKRSTVKASQETPPPSKRPR